ncbi:oligosaccharide flippase family protein [Marinobacter sp. C2H3]|uniref:oligosaccharide flippase family protein n=1 Tax=Marinobacter sp. C2H3 TaxID=3119003 RepID=UPI00300F4EE2
MSLANRLIQSSGLLVAIRFIQRSMGLVSTLVLARLLTPDDFGIIAVAALLIHFSEVLSNTGIQQYLIQADRTDDAIVNTAWTLDVALKSSLALLLYAALPLVGLFYDDPRITQAIAVLIPVIVVRALMNPELHLQRRALKYGVIFRIGVIQKAVSFVVVIGVALYTRSFWAMVVGDLASSVVAVMLSYRYCTRRPALSFANVGDQWQFSRWMLARGSIGYMRAQMDTLFVSKYFSLAQLGGFNMAREFTVMPANEVIQPAIEPLLSAFSQDKSNRKELDRKVRLSVLVITGFTAPIVGFLFFFYQPVVHYLLGSQWDSAAPLMQAMTPLLLAFSMTGILNNVCFSVGRVRTVFTFDTVSLLVIAVSLYLAHEMDLAAFVWLRSLVGLLTVLVFLRVCTGLVGGGYPVYLALIGFPVSLALALAWAIHTAIASTGFANLVICGFVYTGAYLLAMAIAGIGLCRFSPTWQSARHYVVVAGGAVVSRLQRNKHQGEGMGKGHSG